MVVEKMSVFFIILAIVLYFPIFKLLYCALNPRTTWSDYSLERVKRYFSKDETIIVRAEKKWWGILMYALASTLFILTFVLGLLNNEAFKRFDTWFCLIIAFGGVAVNSANHYLGELLVTDKNVYIVNIYFPWKIKRIRFDEIMFHYEAWSLFINMYSLKVRNEHFRRSILYVNNSNEINRVLKIKANFKMA